MKRRRISIARTAILCWIGVLIFGWVPRADAQLKGLPLEELMEVEVTTVLRSPRTVGLSPAAVFVITPEMIRRSGATSIPELLRMVPGMDVARIDNNKWAISARGFNDRFARRLLVQIDGRTVYVPFTSGVYWDAVDFPLQDIARIEVVRGPGASVWGANAVNAVVNIITKPPEDTQGGLLTGGLGSEERGFGTIRYGGTVTPRLFYRVHGKGFARDKQFSTEGNAGDGWEGGSGGLRLDWLANDRDAVVVDGGYLRSGAGRRDLRPMVASPFVFTNIEDEITNVAHVRSNWTRRLNPDSSFTVQLYWDRFARRFEKQDQDVRWDTYDLDLQHELPLGDRQKIVYGAGYRLVNTILENSGRDAGFTTSFRRNGRHDQVFSAFVQDEISLAQAKVRLFAGSKFEHNDFTGFEIQPTLRLLWTPTERQSAWAAISRAVRTPGITEDGILIRTPPASDSPAFPRVAGNPDLKSERMSVYEIGYRVQAKPSLSVDGALFYNEGRDLITNLFPGPAEAGPAGTTTLPLFFFNGLKGRNYGAEVAANWRPREWWHLYGNYAWLKIELKRKPGVPAAAEVGETISARHKAHVQSLWDLPSNFELDLTGRYVSRLAGFNLGGALGVANVIKAYTSLDARLAWSPRYDFELSLVGQNLLDSSHPEFGTNISLRSPLIEIQRGVYIAATWRW